jgi:hypothetical protein
MKPAEPWFLLTNIPVSKLTRQQILRVYARRFEIEEYFKDVKWIQGCEWHQIKKLAVARTVFAFVFLGWWLLLKIYSSAADHPNTRKTHVKKQLSWLRLRIQPIFLSS